ncbi:MAG: flagellar hook-associated protein FlgL [Chloroflexi bacterium]|nr:flagellar hook-associated protein FlgL [Chloroflexota bacterium]
MRITDNMMVKSTMDNLNRNLSRLEKLQSQISSGKRVQRPSDDPVAVAKALRLRASLETMDQQIRNIDLSQGWLGKTESSLAGLGDFLGRARELAVQAGNGTLSPADMKAIAQEVDQLFQQAIQAGNDTYENKYIFAGFKVTTAPFVTSGSPPGYIYRGDQGKMNREIGVNAAVAVNITGSSVFPGVLDALGTLRDRLNAGRADLMGASIGELDAASSQVLANRSSVGAIMNRLASAKDRLQEVQLYTKGLLSEIEDLDMAEAITRYMMQDNVYKASLGVSARAIQPSLLDYLR